MKKQMITRKEPEKRPMLNSGGGHDNRKSAHLYTQRQRAESANEEGKVIYKEGYAEIQKYTINPT